MEITAPVPINNISGLISMMMAKDSAVNSEIVCGAHDSISFVGVMMILLDIVLSLTVIPPG